MVNLGYDSNSKKTITIEFPTIGEYKFDSLEVLCQPMDNYVQQISALSANVMQNVNFHDDNAAFVTNTITGTINLDSAKYILLTIPYANGWTAYVNGEKQEIKKANSMYMAVYAEGYNEIVLNYSTPGFKAGVVISLISFVIFIEFIICRKDKKQIVN